MNHVATGLTCYHCEGTITGNVVTASPDGEVLSFCSPECRDAALRIFDLALDQYYGYRERFQIEPAEQTCCGKTPGGTSDDAGERRMEFALADRQIKEGERQLALHIPDIRCAACTWLIESSLRRRDDVSRVRTVLADRSVIVDYRGDDPLPIVAFIEDLGFTVLPDRGAGVREAQVRERQSMLARLGVAGIGMMQVMMYALATYVAGEGGIEPAYRALMQWASLAVTTPIVLFSAMPFHQGALRDLRHRSPGMDVPVSLAILAAWSLSVIHTLVGSGEVYFDSVSMFTFLLLIGRFVELRSRQRYESSRMLTESLMPASALLDRDDSEGTDRIDIRNITKGMRLRVGVLETVPADGIVVAGRTSVNEAAFTGESVPVEKNEGGRVNAGSVNLEGDIVIEATADWDDFVINRIAVLYREAASWRPRFSTVADRAARWFVLAVLMLATVSGAWWYFADGPWFTVALTVLVVSCPCALSLATPVAYTVALAALRQSGVVVHMGRFLERLASIDAIVFDKTGTLTRGVLRVERTVTLGADSEARVLALAGALERESRHPIALAFLDKSGDVVTERQIVPGGGVAGLIDGREYRLGKPDFAGAPAAKPPAEKGMWILMTADGEPVAWFLLRDERRPEAGQVVNTLTGNYQVAMMTGDSSGEGEALAAELGIGDVTAGMMPEQKVDAIRQRQAQGQVVLMIGDGVNDAAAMSTADASLAVSPADIVVQEAADATLLNSDLMSVPALLNYAHRVRRVIRQNVFWAIGYNMAVIPLAVTGVITPWMAALGMSLSSTLVVLNANRLSRSTGWK